MNKGKAIQPTVWREVRRLRAWELVQKGWKQKDVAEALGVSNGAVSQWTSKARQGGVQALCRRKPPGGPSKLSHRQLARLPELLRRGPAAFGFSGEIWTRRRVAQVIQREFGASCHPTRAGRILKRCGFSLHKPTRRAGQRNGDAIGEWRERRFGQLKKALAEGRTIPRSSRGLALWAGESGFCLLPALLRTWAPVGETR